MNILTTEKKDLKYFCIDCGIYCGPKRYNRNKERCSKCVSKFRRNFRLTNEKKKLNSSTSSN